MTKIRTALALLKRDPKKMVLPLGRMGFLNRIPDKAYLKILYYCETGKKLNLKKPLTFNEKLQWIKLYDRKPEYVTYVDKFAVRDHIKQTIGDEYLIPLIGVYDTVDEIPWNDLPNKFVLKCTHGSGSNIICKDKHTLGIEEANRKLNQWMKSNWYWFGREWCYKDIKPSIICEEFIENETGGQLKDYKFYCFNGEPKMIQVISERDNGYYYLDHFDLEWNEFNIPRKNHSQNPVVQEKPIELNKMIDISRKLSRNIPFARIDLYNSARGIFFGEITFFPVSGYVDFVEEQSDHLLGSWIELPSTWN